MNTAGIHGAESKTPNSSLLEQMKERREQQAQRAATSQIRVAQDSEKSALRSEKVTDTHGASPQKASGTDSAQAILDRDLLTSHGAQYAGHAPESVARNAGTYALENTGDGQKVVYAPLRKEEPETTAEPISQPSEKTPSAQSADAPEAASKPKQPEKPEDGESPDEKKPEKEQKTTCNTDAVDREIRMAKQKVQQLKSAERSASTEEEAAQAKRELAQAERELTQKDNDTYRRAHAQFTTQP